MPSGSQEPSFAVNEADHICTMFRTKKTEVKMPFVSEEKQND